MLGLFERKLKPLNRIEICRKRILENYRGFVERDKGKQFWPVLKANAYGYGIEQITEILEQEHFEYWVVDSYMEALRVWQKSKKRVLLIGPMLKENYRKLDFEKISLMVQTVEELKELGRLDKKVRVHLKVNTGMNRQGFDIEELMKVMGILKIYPRIEVEGVMSHLAEAENDSLTRKQEGKFGQALDVLEKGGIKPKWVHLAASEGAFKTKDKRINAVRLGIGLYDKGLRLVSTVVKVRWTKKGERVSYGGTYVMKKDGRLAVLPVGYYEALDRRLSNQGVVKYKNKYYPIAGRVCMNMTVIDFGRIRIKEREEVEVIGTEGKNSITENAKICQTIPYEMLVRLNGTIRRVIIPRLRL